MAITSNGGGGQEVENLPVEVRLKSRLVGICDLGTHVNYKDDTKLQRKVGFIWEFPEHTYENEGKVIAKTWCRCYTNSTYKLGHMGKMLARWRGKPFTEEEEEAFVLDTLLGLPCEVELEKKGNSVGIDRVFALKEADSLPCFHAPQTYEIERDGQNFHPLMPEWMRKEAQVSKEMAGAAASPASTEAAQAPEDPAVDAGDPPF